MANRKPGPRQGRPKIYIDWEQMDKLCFLRCTLTEIAEFFNVSDAIIEKRCIEEKGVSFKEYFKQKSAGGLISLRRYMWQMAKKNPGMAIFMAKNYLGMTDKQELTGKDGKPVTIKVVYDDESKDLPKR